ncbi:ribonuclease HI [Buchnera aphidicola (Ceratoglyphina bambusae)]|uniref:ribonuclease HI n=1 Tax=Buchnera aphidicola TaxID=9 RepID=UPI0031B84D55
MNKIHIYIDGSCIKNPGPGGYGILLKYKNFEKKISKGFYLTTNNRMELMAAIESLKCLKKKCLVTIITDSKYVILGISNWIKKWKMKKWKNTKKNVIKNLDLWKKLYNLTKKHKIEWIWIKGHKGNYENNICDKLAKNAAKNPIKNDNGYNST